MSTIIVLSDIHFGLTSSTLNDSKKIDNLLNEIWRFGQSCEELVLLGDIFDFWQSRPEDAIRDSRNFFSKLSDLNLEIKYVIGNHDHHLAIMHQESHLIEKLGSGESYPAYKQSMRWFQSIHGLCIEMIYPFYRTRRNNMSFLFTHGHHLRETQTFSFKLLTYLRHLRRKKISPCDLEFMLAYFYESIYHSKSFEEISNFEDYIWRVSNMLGRVNFFLRPLTSKQLDSQYIAILDFMRERSIDNVDCFVFGDTHRAGFYRRDPGPLAANSGNLCGDESDANAGSNTYLIINENTLNIRCLGRRSPLASYDLI